MHGSTNPAGSTRRFGIGFEITRRAGPHNLTDLSAGWSNPERAEGAGPFLRARSCHCLDGAPKRSPKLDSCGCRMDYSWKAQLELAKSRIAGIEDKIALQRQRAEEKDDGAARLISVMQASLARAKAHAEYIEQRIAAHEADSGRRKARATLINIIQIEGRIAEYERKVSALEDAIRAEKDPASAERKIYQRDDLMRAIPALKNILARAKAAEAPSRLKP